VGIHENQESMLLLSHPTGNAYVRQSAYALAQAQLLAEFWTCINWNPDSPLSRLLPGSLEKQLKRRTFDSDIRSKIHTYPWKEAGRLLAPKLKCQSLVKHEIGVFSVDRVFQSFDRKIAERLESQSPGLKGVYAGEDFARQTFQRARDKGIKCFYDLPIGYWKAGHDIYAEEKEREPEWAQTLTGILDSPEKLARKDEELRNADVVFVASSFTRKTLERAPQFTGRVCTVPYGAPPVGEQNPDISGSHTSGKLKLLFVGSLGQRKGLSYLLEAVEKVRPHVELTLIGRRAIEGCVPLEKALREHRWVESLPHQEVLREMREHDVLLFPSLFEGFGLVILEAMSQALPVITTPHTAGPDVITDGDDGFLVPIRSATAIEEKLDILLRDKGILRDMKAAAWRKAGTHSWARYRESQVEIVCEEIRDTL
jgi:glycosyltransferase involved in cell wall biosynthesis